MAHENESYLVVVSALIEAIFPVVDLRNQDIPLNLPEDALESLKIPVHQSRELCVGVCPENDSCQVAIGAQWLT
jgi:hypothetical protein